MIVNKGEEMKKYFLCIYAMLLAFSLGHTITFVHAEETEVPAATVQTGWVTTEDGHKQWLDENGIAVIGWRDIDNFMYYFDNNGYMETGKHFITNKFYLFREDGTLFTDIGLTTYQGNTYWVLEDKSLKTSDWGTVADKTYYFDHEAEIVSGKQNIAGVNYYFNENEEKNLFKNGLVQAQNGEWYYAEPSGVLATSTYKTIGGKTYYFNDNSVLEKTIIQVEAGKTGWQSINGSWYYFNEDSSMHTGWLNYSGRRYYLYPDGMMATGWVFTNGHYQYLDNYGIQQFGWQRVNGKWYYINQDGDMETGWILYNDKQYYLHPDGSMATGWIYTDGHYQYFNDLGIKQFGWQQINGKWYHLNEHGDMETGWITYNSRNYYMRPSGEMATGWVFTNGFYQYLNSFGIQQYEWQLINGHWYYLGSNGNMQTGWISYAGRRYYMKPSGEMSTGWVFTNGHYQYLNNYGIQQYGWQYVYGYWYFLDHYGDMKVGWLELAGKTYYLNASGAMVTGLQWINNKYEYFDQFGALSNESQYKLLNVPNYNQYAEGYPDGCEGVSLFQALQYKGYLGGMSLHNFMYTIPTSTNPFYGYAASGGYAAIFPTPLANWGKGYSGGMTFDISGSSFDNLLEEVKNGNPVIAYVTTYYTPPTWRNYPFGPNLYNNHAVTLDGYDRINNLVHVSDPVSGSKWMDMFTVASVYDARKYAVVVK